APAEERDDSARGRLHFWQVAVTMAEARPLNGVGFNTYNEAYDAYNKDPEFGGARSPHSVWFGLLGELGYPGLLLFVAIWGAAIWSCLRIAAFSKREASRHDLRAYANALLTSLVAFAVAGTFLADQYNEMFWHFVGLSAALHSLAIGDVPEEVP